MAVTVERDVAREHKLVVGNVQRTTRGQPQFQVGQEEADDRVVSHRTRRVGQVPLAPVDEVEQVRPSGRKNGLVFG